MCAAQHRFTCVAINTRIQYKGKEMKMFMNQITAAMDFVYNSVREARLAQRAYEELSRLSDRELSDLGLSRTDIVYVAFSKLKQS
jgi:uncharacterized protein YjiS (DUF1127 family)